MPPIIPDDATVFVVDDDPGIRASLDSLLRSVGLRVLTYSDPADLMISDLPSCASCLLLDVRLKTSNGLDFQCFLKKTGIILPVIIMTGHGDIPMAVRGMKAGAIDFLSKPFSDEALLQAVSTALQLSNHLNQKNKQLSLIKKKYHTLTSREQEVMNFVVAGLMNKQIAAKINLSIVTIKIHRASIMKKMKAYSLADLVRMSEKIELKLDGPKSR